MDGLLTAILNSWYGCREICMILSRHLVLFFNYRVAALFASILTAHYLAIYGPNVIALYSMYFVLCIVPRVLTSHCFFITIRAFKLTAEFCGEADHDRPRLSQLVS